MRMPRCTAVLVALRIVDSHSLLLARSLTRWKINCCAPGWVLCFYFKLIKVVRKKSKTLYTAIECNRVHSPCAYVDEAHVHTNLVYLSCAVKRKDRIVLLLLMLLFWFNVWNCGKWKRLHGSTGVYDVHEATLTVETESQQKKGRRTAKITIAHRHLRNEYFYWIGRCGSDAWACAVCVVCIMSTIS